MVPWQSIQGFSGAAAVGSIVFVDWALITDAFADNLFPVINLYSQSPTWAIVSAVPVLSLVYLLGLLCIGAGETLLIGFRLMPASSLDESSLARSAPSNFVAARYQQLRQDAEVLAGSALALALLAIGASLHAWRLDGWRRFLVSVAVCAVVITLGSLALSIRRHLSAARLAEAHERKAQSEAPSSVQNAA
jgi:hypothetical protein